MMVNSSALLFVMLDESVILFFCSVSTAIRSVGKILECILNLNHLSFNMLYFFLFFIFFTQKENLFRKLKAAWNRHLGLFNNIYGTTWKIKPNCSFFSITVCLISGPQEFVLSVIPRLAIRLAWLVFICR